MLDVKLTGYAEPGLELALAGLDFADYCCEGYVLPGTSAFGHPFRKYERPGYVLTKIEIAGAELISKVGAFSREAKDILEQCEREPEILDFGKFGELMLAGKKIRSRPFDGSRMYEFVFTFYG